MKVLCLGLSNIARRKVLPALETLAGVEAIEVASRRGPPARGETPPKTTRTWASFDDALAGTDAGCAYVSTVNSEHETWARRALEAGLHVLVDKPAILSLAGTEEVVALARSRGLVVAEATVYGAHPQIELCRRIFADEGSRPTRVSATLSMPPLDETNFRYRRALGGGALWDLGPYAVSVGRVVFGSPATGHRAALLSRGGPEGIETAFGMLATHGDGEGVVGHFGFDTEYRNELTVLGPGVSVSFQRAFTTPGDLENRIVVRIRNEETVRTAPAADPFALFLDAFLASLADPAGPRADRFARDMLADARSIRELRASAGVET